LAIVGLFFPLLIIGRKRHKRLAEFEKQFPDALDFISRSVKAGHAFSVSLELLANEANEPLRTEFKKIFHEVNLGSALDAALQSLAQRIPIVDVRFFVSAVLLQRETGGNLAEMLGNLAFVMRERSRIKGHVRSASAHGRITAVILSLMPIALAFGLSVISPDYLPSMVKDPTGKMMLLGSILGQVLGYLCLKKITNIKV